jgi:FemAB-related protein (PEP-CTERM system-associated)
MRELSENPEELFRSFKSKLKSQIRKPEKEGLTCRLDGENLLDDFYGIFCKNMRDLGSPVHSREWFRGVADEYHGRLRFGVIYFKKIPVAAGVILCFKDTVSIPWASSLKQYNALSPNMLLYWNFLKYACESGYRWFDFGRSTPGDGTYKFKEQWGAKPQSLCWYSIRLTTGSPNNIHLADVLAKKNFKREVAAWMWARLPLSLANLIGPRVRKNISL